MRYKQPSYMARTLLKSPPLRQATLNEVVSTVKRECTAMCRQLPRSSILCTGSTSSYRDFNWSLLLNELNSKAPTLLAILKAAAGTKCDSNKSLIPLEVAASILLTAGQSIYVVSRKGESYHCGCMQIKVLPLLSERLPRMVC